MSALGIISREALIAEAKTFINTPFEHQARVKGVGIDCVGLLVCAARNVGLEIFDHRTYARTPDGKTLIKWMDRNCDRVPAVDGQFPIIPGDVGVFWFEKKDKPQHIGLFTPYGILHTYADVKKVCEHKLTKAWRKRIHSVYRFRGIAP